MDQQGQSRINHFLITLPPIVTFVSFFLFWFSIVNPVPDRNLGRSVFSISGDGAASILGKHLQAEGAKALLASAEKTTAGLWIGVLGACARFNGQALDCSGPSADPNYNRFWTTYLTQIIQNPVLVDQGIAALHYDIPAVSPVVFFVSFILLFFGWIFLIIACFPWYGGNFKKDGPFKSIGLKFNQIGLVYSLKCAIVTKRIGKNILRLSYTILSAGWVLGFTASISHYWQWKAVRDAFNPIYATLVAQALTISPRPDPMPELVAAQLDHSCYPMMWVCWALTGFTVIAAIHLTNDYPQHVEDPFQPVQKKETYGWDGSVGGSSQKVNEVDFPETGFVKAMPFADKKEENLNHLLV
ncbi:hypothetical protein BT69DRAFT_1345202 [Atractiella rhizophila]|nr:hypothetical protein BT69DRAFT_1345202 [Atractiella rhizophila]